MTASLICPPVGLHWAEALIGAPWRSGAAGPDAYDCWGLVRAVYLRRMEVDLPILVSDERLRQSELHEAARRLGWRQLESHELMREFDVLLMRHASGLRHVGLVVMAPRPRILHAHGGTRPDGRTWGAVESSDLGELALGGFSRFETWRLEKS